MTWGFKRQVTFIIFLLIFVVFIGFLINYFLFRKDPTCFDNLKNGDESGTDCGGSCLLACFFEVDKISILWSRSMKIAPKTYHAVAYLENHNTNAAIYNISYRFSFYDKDNIFIGKREGKTIVPVARKFAVFEPNIITEYVEPVFTTFEFTEVPIWLQVDNDKKNIQILTSDINLQDGNKPRLSVKLKNNSLFKIPNINAIALLRDKDNNIVSASRTYIQNLNGEETKTIYFTWPEPFFEKIVSEEIIPIFNIFDIK